MMENTQGNNGFWGWFIDMALVGSAAFLYFKTAEVMTALSPETLLGMKGLDVIYGAGTALFIEGVMLSLHFVPAFNGNDRAEKYKWFLFATSTFCQFLDGTVIKQILGQQALTTQGEFFKWVALGIMPAVAAGLLWVRGGNLNVSRVRARRKGLIPAFKEFLYGEENTRVFSEPATLNQDVRQMKKVKSSNGKHPKEEETVDP